MDLLVAAAAVGLAVIFLQPDRVPLVEDRPPPTPAPAPTPPPPAPVESPPPPSGYSRYQPAPYGPYLGPGHRRGRYDGIGYHHGLGSAGLGGGFTMGRMTLDLGYPGSFVTSLPVGPTPGPMSSPRGDPLAYLGQIVSTQNQGVYGLYIDSQRTYWAVDPSPGSPGRMIFLQGYHDLEDGDRVTVPGHLGAWEVYLTSGYRLFAM